MQDDGNLAVCAALEGGAGSKRCKGAVLWSTGTGGHPGAYATMAEYGCLDVWPSGSCEPGTDCRLWQSHTMALAGCGIQSSNCSYIEIQKDANVVMRTGAGPAAAATAGKVIWSTGTRLLPKGVKNVLWMIADDMRPDMNVAYGQHGMITPAFDRLAREGTVFTRAYCQIAVCAPSRNSFM
jgi:hypothetical protein